MKQCSRGPRVPALVHVLTLLLACAGCAATPVATAPIRYADLGHTPKFDFRVPFVIEFQAGDRVPIDFDFNGEDFELVPAHPAMEFVAKHHCFVRFSAEGVRASLDPRDFSEKPKTPGSFRFALNVQRGQPAKLDVGIATPRR